MCSGLQTPYINNQSLYIYIYRYERAALLPHSMGGGTLAQPGMAWMFGFMEMWGMKKSG